jgi:hypothetical protein
MLGFQDLLDIGLSPDADTLQARLVSASAQLGFGLSAGVLIRGRLTSGRAAVHSFGNPPAGFLESSKSLDDGLKDPFLSSLLAGPGVAFYDQGLYERAGVGCLWDHQAAFGYRHGMAVSMHESSHAEMFSFGVDGPDAIPINAPERYRLEGSLRLVALHAHSAAKRLFTPAPLVDLNALDHEEVEALKWAADAQVVQLRGDKVVITNPNRTRAQRTAAQKLAATSGPMAVLRAIEGGLIERT